MSQLLGKIPLTGFQFKGLWYEKDFACLIMNLREAHFGLHKRKSMDNDSITRSCKLVSERRQK